MTSASDLTPTSDDTLAPLPWIHKRRRGPKHRQQMNGGCGDGFAPPSHSCDQARVAFNGSRAQSPRERPRATSGTLPPYSVRSNPSNTSPTTCSPRTEHFSNGRSRGTRFCASLDPNLPDPNALLEENMLLSDWI